MLTQQAFTWSSVDTTSHYLKQCWHNKPLPEAVLTQQAITLSSVDTTSHYLKQCWHNKPLPEAVLTQQAITSVDRSTIMSLLGRNDLTILWHLGPSEDADNFQHELRGIIPRSFEYLFNRIERQKELVSIQWNGKFLNSVALYFCYDFMGVLRVAWAMESGPRTESHDWGKPTDNLFLHYLYIIPLQSP